VSGEFPVQLKAERNLTVMVIDRIALVIAIIGALNWGSIGLFNFDVVAWICGGQGALLSRIIYTIVALSGIWLISLVFRTKENVERIED
jgi:uncharacterized membrane protein YuzA (DUF378 family)